MTMASSCQSTAPKVQINYTSNSVTATVVGNSNKVTTTTTLAASNPSPPAGGSVTYTATVTPRINGANEPSGTVEFLDGGISISSCSAQPLTAGSTSATATCTVSYSAPGPHPITATYGGDTNFTGSSSPTTTVTVDAATPGSVTTSPATGVGATTSPATGVGATTSPATGVGTTRATLERHHLHRRSGGHLEVRVWDYGGNQPCDDRADDRRGTGRHSAGQPSCQRTLAQRGLPLPARRQHDGPDSQRPGHDVHDQLYRPSGRPARPTKGPGADDPGHGDMPERPAVPRTFLVHPYHAGRQARKGRYPSLRECRLPNQS